MKHRRIEILRTGMLVLSAVLFAALVWVLWRTIPWSAVRYGILGLCAAIFAVVGLWAWYQRRQVSLFADDLGETLDALQYLTSLRINKGQDHYTRVTLDTENYRAKREDTLIRLANRMANRAVKTGRKVSLEPMNPYERRVIHSALQPNELVDTHSEGEEPKRHIVITLRK